jgi:hypothetical protein
LRFDLRILLPGARDNVRIIAQSNFWLENCTDEETFGMYINGIAIPRYRRIPRIRKREDFSQFVRTHLISNATGEFRYDTDPRRQIRFGTRQGQHGLALHAIAVC